MNKTGVNSAQVTKGNITLHTYIYIYIYEEKKPELDFFPLTLTYGSSRVQRDVIALQSS